MNRPNRSILILAIILLTAFVCSSFAYADGLNPIIKFNSDEIRKALPTGSVTIVLTVSYESTVGGNTQLETMETSITVGQGAQTFNLANLPKGKVLTLQAQAKDASGKLLGTPISALIESQSADTHNMDFNIDALSTIGVEIAQSVATSTGRTSVYKLSNSEITTIRNEVKTAGLTGLDTSEKKAALVAKLAKPYDATLSGLTVSPGTLEPTFATATANYSVSLPYTASTITVTPTAKETTATIVLKNGTTIVTNPISLSSASTTITIEVTSPNSINKKTYTVVITKAAAPSANANLSGITLSSGTLTPAFAAATTTYTASVANSVSTITVTPQVQESNATFVLKKGTTTVTNPVALTVGSNAISIEVTAQDGTTKKTYTVTVTRADATASNNANLSGITLSSGTLTPAFAAATTTYTASVANTVTQITVTPTVQESHATFVLKKGTTTVTNPVALTVGSNVISIEVTAQDGTTKKTYTVTVTRAGATLSNNANLSGITLSSGTLTPAFAAATLNYTASVANSVSTITVTPTVQESNATFVLKKGTTTVTNPVALTVGSNVISIEVTAQDGTTKKTYTVTVTRAQAPATGLTVHIKKPTAWTTVNVHAWIRTSTADTPITDPNTRGQAMTAEVNGWYVYTIPTTDIAHLCVLFNGNSWDDAMRTVDYAPDQVPDTEAWFTPNPAPSTGRYTGVWTTQNPDVMPNQPISNFAFTGAATDTTLPFSWTQALNATALKIQQSPETAISWTDSLTSPATLGVAATGASVTGLTANTSYKFRLVVTGGANAGNSNEVTAKTASEARNLTVHFKKPAGWATPQIYFYNTLPHITEPAWGSSPSMQDESDGWYSYSLGNIISAVVIFKDGASSAQIPARTGGSDGYVITNDTWVKNATTYSSKPPVDKPIVSVSPGNAESSYDFADATLTLTLHVSDDEITASKYTTDGTDPATSNTAIAYTDGKQITIGQNMASNATTSVRVYAVNSVNVSSSTTYQYRKVTPQMNIERLGATYTPTQTTFALWSPSSSNVVVNVDGQNYTCSLAPAMNGYTDVYYAVVPNVQKFAKYYFEVNGTRVNDPYGIMCDTSTNSATDTYIVMDLADTNPDGWSSDTRPNLAAREDSIVYELHIRDITMDPSINISPDIRGRYLGAVKTGLTSGGQKVGIDHLKELGVTHVQLLPLEDANYSERDTFSWGYDPRNYNIPEARNSQYLPSTTDTNYYINRIKEYKQMVQEFHKNGIRVIMDVVYNHLNNDVPFSNITQRYFTLQDLAGAGGRTLNTAEPMVSRFIQDSLEYWVKEYHVDGFRFDLMGAFDYPETAKWNNRLREVSGDNNILFYGEPWVATSDPWVSSHIRQGKMPALAGDHVGVFDDQFRNALRGSNNRTNTTPTGYIYNQGGTGYNNNIMWAIKGSTTAQNSSALLSADFDPRFALDPEQAIHYLAAHDNYCLWDMIKRVGFDNDQGKKIDMFAQAMLLTSQGIPFIHAGDEMLRTKYQPTSFTLPTEGSDAWGAAYNSYNQPDGVNMIRWQWKNDNATVLNYAKGLIAMRKAHPAFRMQTWDQINTNVRPSAISGNIIETQIDGSAVGDSWSKIILIYNPGSPYQYNLQSTDWYAGTWYKANWDNGSVSGTPVSGTITCDGPAVTVLYQQ